MHRTRSAGLKVLLFLLVSAAVLWITSKGPFLNEDYEKIALHSSFYKNGSLLEKLSSPEAGYEAAYFRPANNFLLALLVRSFGVESAAPYRVAGSLAFLAAALSVYWAARRMGVRAAGALACAVFFAANPFTVWFYFQGSWIGNSLAVPLMIGVIALFMQPVAAQTEVQIERRSIRLFALVFLAGLCKDSAILVVGLLLPLAFFGRQANKRSRWLWWGSALAGALAILFCRAAVVHPDPHYWKSDPVFALTHAGWLWWNYAALTLQATVANYARVVPQGPGWPFTVGAGVVFFAILFGLRRRPKEAFLWWCIGVLFLESLVASFRSFWIVPTRIQFLLAAAAIFIALLLQSWKAEGTRLRLKKISVAALLGWFLAPAFTQFRASLDADSFYILHNSQPYSWKLLGTEGGLRFRQGRYPAAEKLFRESLSFYQATFFYRSLGQTLALQGRYQEALGPFVQALIRNPWSETILEEMTPSLEKASDPLESSLEWSKIDPLGEAPMIYNNLGVRMGQKNQTQKARLFFQRALKVQPDYESAHHNLVLMDGGV